MHRPANTSETRPPTQSTPSHRAPLHPLRSSSSSLNPPVVVVHKPANPLPTATYHRFRRLAHPSAPAPAPVEPRASDDPVQPDSLRTSASAPHPLPPQQHGPHNSHGGSPQDQYAAAEEADPALDDLKRRSIRAPLARRSTAVQTSLTSSPAKAAPRTARFTGEVSFKQAAPADRCTSTGASSSSSPSGKVDSSVNGLPSPPEAALATSTDGKGADRPRPRPTTFPRLSTAHLSPFQRRLGTEHDVYVELLSSGELVVDSRRRERTAGTAAAGEVYLFSGDGNEVRPFLLPGLLPTSDSLTRLARRCPSFAPLRPSAYPLHLSSSTPRRPTCTRTSSPSPRRRRTPIRRSGVTPKRTAPPPASSPLSKHVCRSCVPHSRSSSVLALRQSLTPCPAPAAVVLPPLAASRARRPRQDHRLRRPRVLRVLGNGRRRPRRRARDRARLPEPRLARPHPPFSFLAAFRARRHLQHFHPPFLPPRRLRLAHLVHQARPRPPPARPPSRRSRPRSLRRRAFHTHARRAGPSGASRRARRLNRRAGRWARRARVGGEGPERRRARSLDVAGQQQQQQRGAPRARTRESARRRAAYASSRAHGKREREQRGTRSDSAEIRVGAGRAGHERRRRAMLAWLRLGAARGRKGGRCEARVWEGRGGGERGRMAPPVRRRGGAVAVAVAAAASAAGRVEDGGRAWCRGARRGGGRGRRRAVRGRVAVAGQQVRLSLSHTCLLPTR